MLNALLIGSQAMKISSNDPLVRSASDTDYIATPEFAEPFIKSPDWSCRLLDADHLVAVLNERGVPQEKRIVEIEIAWPGSTGEELLQLLGPQEKFLRKDANGIRVAPLDVLYTLKMSHRYLRNSPHFLKTMDDIKRMRTEGVDIPSYLNDWYERRQTDTYNYKHPSLNQTKDQFFDGDGVQYTWDHDDIHKAVAHEREPAYLRYLVPGEQVKCSKDLFWQAPELTRLRGVYEEAMVLAIERSIWPFNHRNNPHLWNRIFLHALMKVCTSITSGWFREYAWDNYYRVAAMFNAKDIERFFEWVDAGKIGRFKS